MDLNSTNPEYAAYARNFIFGVEDSLVSTVGLLSGIAASGTERSIIVMTGLVLIFVEAFSMGVGSYLSERSTSGLPSNAKISGKSSATAGFVMLGSYIMSGLIPLFPYLVTTGTKAFVWSIVCSLIALLILGLVSGKKLLGAPLKNGLRFLLLGGLAIGIGVLVGSFAQGLT